jgi:hypothetical protein
MIMIGLSTVVRIGLVGLSREMLEMLVNPVVR